MPVATWAAPGGGFGRDQAGLGATIPGIFYKAGRQFFGAVIYGTIFQSGATNYFGAIITGTVFQSGARN